MFLWQIQNLIDLKQNNYHGAPFKMSLLQSQARQFTLIKLLTLHQDLIGLDYRSKTGKLKLSLEKELFLRLETI
jgi:hypothetical protein